MIKMVWVPKTPGETCAAITCADGFNMSVQGSSFHYCSPRDDSGSYTHVEVGFPSKKERVLMPYCGDPDKPTGTVYANVPVEVIAALIKKHGGIK